MSIRLVCIDAVPSTESIRIDSLPVSLGRGDEADVCIRDNWASRVNCRLIAEENQLFVEDLRSSNGTRVNGQSVTRRQLKSGDQLSLGITTFRVTWSRLPAMQYAGAPEPVDAHAAVSHH